MIIFILIFLIVLSVLFIFIFALKKEISKRKETEHALLKSIDELKFMEIDLAKAKEKAEASSRSKTEFLANMSHEIRTPMNSVLGFTELLERTELEDMQASYVESIKSSGKNLLSLINDILDLSKIEAGKLSVQKKPFNLKQLLEEVQQVFALAIQTKGLDFMIDFSCDIPKLIYSDEVRIRQILLNLVGNAVKFTDKGFVNILIDLVYKDENYLTLNIYVVDSGIGIAKENQEKIFENFEQQKYQNYSFGGTGLGLAICKRLANKLGGEIRLTSKEMKGSTFSLHLENIKYSNNFTIQKNSTKVYAFKEANILLIDEHKENRELIKGILQEQNIMIVEAHNIEIALEYIDKIELNLILIDLRNPMKNGPEVTRALRDRLSYKLTPIIAITASVYDDVKSEEKHGFDEIVYKPLVYEIFMDSIANFLDLDSVEALELKPKEIKSLYLGDDVKSIYHNEFYANLLEQKKKNNFKELSELSSRMLKFSIKYQLDDLADTIRNLENSIKIFDIEMIKKILTKLTNIAI